MTTTIFEVTFKDGRKYKVFTANSAQKRKFLQSYNKLKPLCADLKDTVNGIHTFKQWTEIIPHL